MNVDNKRHQLLCVSLIPILFLLLASPISAQAQEARVYPVYQLDTELEIRELDPETFVVTHRFPWAANSLIILIGEQDAVFVDTPYTPEATEAVLDWITDRHGDRRFIEINTGYHVDNLGGNQALVARNIPIYGSDKTVALLREKGEATRQLMMSWLNRPADRHFRASHATILYVEPTQIFPLADGITITLGKEKIEVFFPGETHAPDNIVVYFPQRRLLFAGCMLLAGNSPGNTADANMSTWKSSVQSLRTLGCTTVIPGHGLRFDPGVIENTLGVLP